MSDICGCVKESGGGYAVRIVRGNSFTLEAAVSVYDPEDGGYAAVDLTDAEDVRLCVIGNTRVAGTDVRAAGNIVTARFSGAQGCGAYGVELTWRVGEDNFRVHEGGLFEVVNDSADATIGTSSAGGSGEGLDVSVDLRTRTLRVGKTVWVTDYNALDHRPSIGGVTLEGDRTPSELGMYSREEADALLGGKQDALVSGTSIKTVNGESLLGGGNIETGAAVALTPYDCTWVWGLSQGDEAPEDKTDELIKAIEDGRNLITKYTDKDGYQIVTGVNVSYENKGNTSLTLFSSYLNSLSWILIDDSSDAYAYVVSARGVFASQEKLVSGTNIKTVNGQSLLGEGDIDISVAVDAELSETSVNPVQNKAVVDALAAKVDVEDGKTLSSNDYTDGDKAKVAAAVTEARVRELIDNAVTAALNTEV